MRAIYKESNLEIYVDNAFISRIKIHLKQSKKGYLIEDKEGLKFNAISHNAFNDSSSEERTVAPGIIYLEGNENKEFLEKRVQGLASMDDDEEFHEINKILAKTYNYKYRRMPRG